MKPVFQTSARPRDVVIGWRELAYMIGRPEDSVRVYPPNWLAALPCWQVGGARCWDAGEIANAIAGSKPAMVRTIRRDPAE